ncbi:restriction endonuclease subunit S [Phocaeicola vulgatus]|uniref:restriction endonuclease subunit S n=1 Tax=Phocaeicola vulgatus TaxID=821 RepID=UPI0022E567CB|nr:restriction endonuclease subunit S [Phocaeicola vulgatus]
MVLPNSLSSYYEKFLTTGEVKCIDEEIPFEIPKGWEWTRIRNISQSYIGLTYSPTDVSSRGTIVLRSSNIQNGKIVLNDVVRVSKEISEKLQVEKNDIIICARNGSAKLVGKSAVVTDVTEPMTFGAFMAICKTALYQYVSIFLQSDLFFSQLRGVSGTTTINQLTQNNFNDFWIPIPPANEQKRIVEKLQNVSPFIERYSKSQETLNLMNIQIKEQLKKSILQEAIQGKLIPQIAEEGTAQELLEQIRQEKQKLVKEGKLKKSVLTDSVIYKGDDNKYYEQIGKKCLDITEQIPFEIPANWAWARMGQIGDWGAGSTPQRGNVNYYNGKILWLKTGELNNGIVYDTEEKITQKAFQDCSLRMNKIGDVLIAMYGATIGKLAIVGKELTTNQACCGCTPYLIYNWYIFYFLMASRDSFIKKGEGGAQPNISRVKLVEHLIPLPPLKEQYRIVAQIEKLFEQLR